MSAVNATIESKEKWAKEKLSKYEGMVLENSIVLENLKDKVGPIEVEKKE